MTSEILRNLDRFYDQLARLATLPTQGMPLREIRKHDRLPDRGVYFFHEPGEFRTTRAHQPRIVRVGTHALTTSSRATLRDRLKLHLGSPSGSGNHRGSAFRKLVGAALLADEGATAQFWGKGSKRPADLRNNPGALDSESKWERKVSERIGSMPLLWIDVPCEGGRNCDRSVIERNAIALLSNRLEPNDRPGPGWLGRKSPKQEVAKSGLWNIDYVNDDYKPGFLDVLESYVDKMCESVAGDDHSDKFCWQPGDLELVSRANPKPDATNNP